MSLHQPTSAPSLEHAHYGIGFVDAITRAYRKYATFSGRASRGEYWWFVLFVSIVYLVLGGAAGAVGAATSPDRGTTPGLATIPIGILLGIFLLGSIVPSIAVSVRRLHDAGYSGLLYLITLFPYLGSFILIFFMAMRTSPAGDRYEPGAVAGYPGAPGQYGYPTPYAPPGYGQPGYAQPGYRPPGYPQQQPYGPADPYAQPGSSQTDPYKPPT